MRCRAIATLAAVILAAPPDIRAQGIESEASAGMRCLTLADGADRQVPEYPFEAWKGGLAGRVKVELRFEQPDRAPRSTVLEREGENSFVESVEQFVGKLRVPCLAKEAAPARLVIDYRFKPDERQAVASPTFDPDQQRANDLARCVVHLQGSNRMEYPRALLDEGIQGRVYLRLRFEAPDRPPKIEALAREAAGRLRGAVRRWADGLRMPCHSGAPVAVTMLHIFRIQDSGGYGFKDASLPQFLRSVKAGAGQAVSFDFRTMGCPFDLRFTYLQPLADNRVHELERHDPERQPFLQWLRRVQLDLPEATLDAAFGDQLTLTVPCTRIDLNPKEKTS
jgi:hypothetical protein